MPRYFFHVHDGVSFPDDEGTELRDLHAARAAAVTMSGEMLKANTHDFWQGDEWKMDVTDETGMILFTLMFMAISAPDTERAR